MQKFLARNHPEIHAPFGSCHVAALHFLLPLPAPPLLLTTTRMTMKRTTKVVAMMTTRSVRGKGCIVLLLTISRQYRPRPFLTLELKRNFLEESAIAIELIVYCAVVLWLVLVITNMTRIISTWYWGIWRIKNFWGISKIEVENWSLVELCGGVKHACYRLLQILNFNFP